MDSLEDDSFSDGTFDDLAPNAWVELEQNALIATQRIERSSQRVERYSTVHLNANKELSEAAAAENDTGEETWVQDADTSTPAEEKATFSANAGGLTEKEKWRVNRFADPNRRVGHPRQMPRPYNNAPRNSGVRSDLRPLKQLAAPSNIETVNENAYRQEDVMLVDPEPSQVTQAIPAAQEEALHAQIEDLLRDRDQLSRQLNDATSTVLAQKGEIAVVRANQNDASKTFDRRLAALKKSIEEDAMKNQARLDAVNSESKRILSENQFLKHNLTEEVDRVKNLQRNLKERSKEGQSPLSTPKKNRILPLRDGFNDVELVVKSPAKSGRKSGPTTPSAGTKRKRRPTMNSPVPALNLSQGIVEDPHQGEIPNRPENKAPDQPKVVVMRDNEGLNFLQRLLNYRVTPGGKRMLEVFADLSLPSDNSQLFSSIFVERTACLSGKTLPPELTKVLISLWSSSLNEKYHQALPVLVDIVSFILHLNSSIVAPFVIEDLLKVLQRTIELNGIPRFQHSPVSHLASGNSKQTPKSKLVEVDETACLELLYITACACAHTEKHLKHLWQIVSPDLVLMMLNSSQLIPNIVLMLDILATSILPTTFGTIVASEADQAAIEKHIINRVTWLLWEKPRVDEGDKPYLRREICEFRLEVMSLLSLLAFASPHPHDDATRHSSTVLARHPTAIARIFRCMYDELDALYTHPPEHELHARLVNEGARIVHHLLRLHGGEIDLSQKLSTINGGVQKHRVVLTRLAFSEGLLLEAGISDETVVMAHDMLEQAVTPEEAEALMDVFNSSRGGRE